MYIGMYIRTYCIIIHHCGWVWVWYVANEGYNRSTDQSLRHFDLTIFLMWYKLNVHSMNVNPAAAISLTTPTTAYTHAVRYVCTPAIELKHHCTVLRMYTPMNDASFPGWLQCFVAEETVKWHALAILTEDSTTHVHVHKYCGYEKSSNNNLFIVQCVHVHMHSKGHFTEHNGCTRPL